MMLPGIAGTPGPGQPAARARRTTTGRLAVEMVAADRRPSTVLTRASFLNAIVALAAIGGSTNAVVHLLAIAGRLGVDADPGRLRPDRLRRAAAGRPAAGRAVPDGGPSTGPAACSPCCARSRTCSTPTALTVTGEPLVDYLDDAEIWDREVIRPRAEPLQPDAGIAVLYGNLAPDGAVIKPAAASPHLLQHRGRARGLRQRRGLARPHRRSRPGRRRRLGAGAARLRPAGLPRHARGRQPAAAGEAAGSRASATWSASATAG